MTEWSNNEPIVCWPYTNYTQIHRKRQRQRRPRRRRRRWWVGILNRFTNSRAPCSGLERDNGSAGSKSKTWLDGKMFHRRRRRQWNRNFPEKSLRSPVLDCNCSAANFDGIAGYNWWFCCGCCFYIFANYEMTIIIPIACRCCKFCTVHRFGSSQSLWERKIRLFRLILFAHLRDGDFWYEETPNLLRRRGVRITIGWLSVDRIIGGNCSGKRMILCARLSLSSSTEPELDAM